MNTDKKQNKTLLLYKLTVIALTAISAALCAICTAFYFDYSPGYFKSSVIVSLFWGVTALACVFSLSSFLLFKKSFKLKSPESTDSPELICIIPACGFLFYTISIASRIFFEVANTNIFFIQATLSLISFFHFLSLTLKARISKGLKTFLGLASIFSLILITARSYFDYHTVMNSPEKTLLQITLILFALYIINEVRFIWEECYPRLYLSLCGIIASLATVFTLHKIFIIINSNQISSSEDVAICILMATIAAYVLLRLIYTAPDNCDTAPVTLENSKSESAEHTPIPEENAAQSQSENTDLNTNI